MNDIVFKQITKLDEENLGITTNWMYNWWGEKEGYTFDEVKCFMEHSLQKDRLPQTYGIFHKSKIIGMYQFAYEDLSIRPDIYPWLCNLYVHEEYRNKGIGRFLIENVKKTAKQNTKFDEIYLYTKHIGLYEKFGWYYVSEIDTYSKEPRIQRLYKLDLKI